MCVLYLILCVCARQNTNERCFFYPEGRCCATLLHIFLQRQQSWWCRCASFGGHGQGVDCTFVIVRAPYTTFKSVHRIRECPSIINSLVTHCNFLLHCNKQLKPVVAQQVLVVLDFARFLRHYMTIFLTLFIILLFSHFLSSLQFVCNKVICFATAQLYSSPDTSISKRRTWYSPR